MRVIFGAASQSQTFTTGSNPNGYDVTGITVRLAGFTNNTASGANQTSWNLSASLGPIVARSARSTEPVTSSCPPRLHGGRPRDAAAQDHPQVKASLQAIPETIPNSSRR